MLAGCDEVGRGCLAGPVVACAVVITQETLESIPGITDSKKLSPQQRESLYNKIVLHADAISLGLVSNTEIDRINILQASKRAMEIAINNLSPKPDHVLIDGRDRLNIDISHEAIIDGDFLVPIISCASIIAKVYRDRFMMELDTFYPQYNFKAHKGYCTREHEESIKKYGVSDVHRKTFRGVKEHISL